VNGYKVSDASAGQAATVTPGQMQQANTNIGAGRVNGEPMND